MPDQEVQNNIQQLQALRKRVESLIQTKEILKTEIEELNETLESLDEIRDVDGDEEVFIPLGSGSYALGEITETEKVLVNVGGSAIIKEDISDAKDIIEGKKKDFREQISETDDAIQKAEKKLQKLQANIGKSSR